MAVTILRNGPEIPPAAPARYTHAERDNPCTIRKIRPPLVPKAVGIPLPGSLRIQPLDEMKLISLVIACIPLVAAAGESYFFVYKKGSGETERRIEENRLHTVNGIQKIDPPKATRLTAFHQGLGSGRAYQIQIDLEGTLEEHWYPMLKLGDDIITGGIMVGYSNSRKWPSSVSIEHDDPEKITRWCGLLGSLLGLPADRIDIDLAKADPQNDEQPDAAPQPNRENGKDREDHLTPDTRWRLNGESEWKLKQGPTISLRESKTAGFSFHDPAGNELFRLEKHELIRGVVGSPRHTVLLFQISNEDGFGGCVLRVSLRDRVPGFERVFAHPATPLFEGKRWWISDLGAVSNDGDVVLAKIGWMPQNTGRVSYEWQTWSIGKQKKLGSGLRIGNAAIQPAE